MQAHSSSANLKRVQQRLDLWKGEALARLVSCQHNFSLLVVTQMAQEHAVCGIEPQACRLHAHMMWVVSQDMLELCAYRQQCVISLHNALPVSTCQHEELSQRCCTWKGSEDNMQASTAEHMRKSACAAKQHSWQVQC